MTLKDGTDMSAGFVQTYRAFAYNNAWANHRLLTACAKLDQQAFEAERTGFFPSLQMTLNHIYVVDLFYVDALEGGSLGPNAWENHVPCPSCDELRHAQAAVDKRLIAVCNALTPDLLGGIVQVNRDTRVQTERRDRLLMHLFQHQILNSTSSFRSRKRRSGPSSSTVLVGPKKRYGDRDRFLRSSIGGRGRASAFLPASGNVILGHGHQARPSMKRKSVLAASFRRVHGFVGLPDRDFNL
jgi:uncharacterized damage-inducible protein DinB